MDRDRIYLDYNASAPPRPAARAAMAAWLDCPGNASSVHAEGRAARRKIETARDALAALLGCPPQSVTFVSGATEANNTVLQRRWKIHEEDVVFQRLFVSAVEHPSVLAGGRFPAERVEALPVDADGLVDAAVLDERLSETDGPALVSIMTANNETGTVQSVAALADIVHRHGGRLHTDAVQALGRMPVDLDLLGADAVTVSAHKLGAIQGAGAIATAPGVAIPALLRGGGQEAFRRAGTEAAGAIAAFGAVLDTADTFAEEAARIRRLRDWLEAELTHIPTECTVFGRTTERLGNTSCFALPGVRAETAMIAFDLNGIAVSSGSACSSGKVSASHVLKAMGVDDTLAAGAIRVSLGWATTQDELAEFLQVLETVCKKSCPQGQNKAA